MIKKKRRSINDTWSEVNVATHRLNYSTSKNEMKIGQLLPYSFPIIMKTYIYIVFYSFLLLYV